MTPNFLVIGASKCGTSSLCLLLGQHPDVFVSDPKEPNFFCYDHIYARGWGWYARLFREAEGKAAVGEGTTQYSMRRVWPKTCERIARHLPHAKLIYIVRHPMDRMESLWVQMLEHNYRIPPGFNNALEHAREYFIDSSDYLGEIDVFRRYYQDDRILVLFFEDFRRNPEVTLSQCFEFLGVDTSFRTSDSSTPRNISLEKRVEPAWLKRVRMLRSYDSISSLLPSRLKQAVRRRSLVAAPERPRWPAETRRWVLAELGSNTATFLHRYGKSADYWDLEGWAQDRHADRAHL